MQKQHCSVTKCSRIYQVDKATHTIQNIIKACTFTTISVQTGVSFVTQVNNSGICCSAHVTGLMASHALWILSWKPVMLCGQLCSDSKWPHKTRKNQWYEVRRTLPSTNNNVVYCSDKKVTPRSCGVKSMAMWLGVAVTYWRPCWGALHTVALASHLLLYFQQGGTPVHFSFTLCQWFHHFLCGWWVGPRGLVKWPP
jgi:hypothetical protein